MVKDYDINQVMRDAIFMRETQRCALEELHCLKDGRSMDSLIARLRELDAYRSVRYPDMEVPKELYDFVLERAKDILSPVSYETLVKMVKIDKNQIRDLSSADIEFLKKRGY